ncbi:MULTISPECIES: hypothetical protein [unclassified Clostridium]|uniref:hypothetical protein n=1 Tax=unclassified Clostridium TaxID=2614128 RepID=UPI0025BA9696|nr:hypothetical protein [Clostridium sp.]MDY4252994.1 hypothetical protein [Clostridium sp.]
MKREDLRKVEVIIRWDLMTLPGPTQTKIGEDSSYVDGYFHGWSTNGDLKGIVELDDGVIELIPYKDIRFLE